MDVFLISAFSTFFNAVFFDIALSTNPIEAMEFLSVYLPQNLAPIAVFALFSVAFLFLPLLRFARPRFQKPRPRILGLLWRFSAVFVFALCVLGAGLKHWQVSQFRLDEGFFAYFSDKNTFFRYGEALKNTLKNQAYIAQYKALRSDYYAHQRAANYSATSRENLPTVVLIIGESTQRNHMQLYGHPLKNTPNLVRLRDSGNLVVFSDTIAPHSHTNLVLEKMLTFKNYENASSPWFKQQNLVDVMRLAGYKTHWISNQESTSIYGNAPEIIATRSDVVRFSEKAANSYTAGKFGDEVVIAMFEKMLGEGARKPLDSRDSKDLSKDSADSQDSPREWDSQKDSTDSPPRFAASNHKNAPRAAVSNAAPSSAATPSAAPINAIAPNNPAPNTHAQNPAPSPKNFYIFHLMGTHMNYKARYPAAFAKFSAKDFAAAGLDWLNKATKLTPRQAKMKAEYANAIFYNDAVVSGIMERFKDEDALVFYISDHGDEVYDFRDFVGHTESLASRFMVEVPFVAYMSDVFKAKHPAIAARIAAAKDRPFMSDDFIHAFMDILGIESADFVARRSIFNADFDATRERIYGGKNYDIELRGVKSGAEFEPSAANPSKIWLHRTDELKKFADFKEKYFGFEIDVHFLEEGAANLGRFADFERREGRDDNGREAGFKGAWREGGFAENEGGIAGRESSGSAKKAAYFDVGHDGAAHSIGLGLEEMLLAMRDSLGFGGTANPVNPTAANLGAAAANLSVNLWVNPAANPAANPAINLADGGGGQRGQNERDKNERSKNKIQPANAPRIWLDFKNLSPQNAQKSLSNLLQICQKLKLPPSLFIVESPQHTLLAPFRAAGFKASYYVPYYSNAALEAQKSAIVAELGAIAASGSVDFLSFPYYLYDFMKAANLRRCDDLECVDMPFLSWNEGQNALQNAQIRGFYDPQVKVILAGERGNYR